jgi:hypothetical protein
VIGIPLASKKDVVKKFKRREAQGTYTQGSTEMVWRDNQPM